MATTGLEAWDKTVQTTNIWLDEIMEELAADRQAAWHALGAVLRALRDRLPIELGAHLGAQLPLLVRGAYYDQWHVGGLRQQAHGVDEFMAMVAENLGRTRPVDPAVVTGAVFRTLVRHVDPGQVQKVLGALPSSIRDMLRDAASV
jgi:uncharacterized protein (DUF2267 family)